MIGYWQVSRLNFIDSVWYDWRSTKDSCEIRSLPLQHWFVCRPGPIELNQSWVGPITFNSQSFFANLSDLFLTHWWNSCVETWKPSWIGYQHILVQYLIFNDNYFNTFHMKLFQRLEMTFKSPSQICPRHSTRHIEIFASFRPQLETNRNYGASVLKNSKGWFFLRSERVREKLKNGTWEIE